MEVLLNGGLRTNDKKQKRTASTIPARFSKGGKNDRQGNTTHREQSC